MKIIEGFKYKVGDVLVPLDKNKSFFLKEIIVDDIHVKDFMYSVIDLDGERWQTSPFLIENEFVLKEDANVQAN